MSQIFILMVAISFFNDIIVLSVPLKCGSTIFDITNQICCCVETIDGGQICKSHVKKHGVGCCGNDAMDSGRGDYCCGTKLQKVCHRPLEPTYFEWCGIQKVDITKELCCNGVRRNLKDGMLCCNTRNYNPARKICCDGELLPLHTGHYCCGNKNFGPFYQCCNAYTGKIRVRGLCHRM